MAKKSMIRDRLEGGMDEVAFKFTSSIEHDREIFFYDILVDVAHVLTLHKAGYLTSDEAKSIIEALKTVSKKFPGNFEGYEDIHEAIESEVTKITEAGLKMHTGRSRNDEVATCLRMFARDNLILLMEKILGLLETLLRLAEENYFPMPGFTHLQFAQPTRLSHHLIAYFDALERDFERCMNAFGRVNLSPLGSAAFAGSGYNLDREYSARLLGFSGIVENSEDAVASRDFIVESLFAATSVMLSLSRIAEEIILWSSEFDFVELSDRYSSVSSIMPQKKNPDVAELVRAKTGKMVGNLMAAMSIYKALPFSYNRDFQEMNELLYSVSWVEAAVEVVRGMLSEIKFKKDVMEEKALKGFTAATEIADKLVRNCNIPFRIAHRIVARLASRGIFKPGKEDIVKAAEEFGYEIGDVDTDISLESILESRKVRGGTAMEEIRRMINSRKARIEEKTKKIERMKREIEEGIKEMIRECEEMGIRWDFNRVMG